MSLTLTCQIYNVQNPIVKYNAQDTNEITGLHLLFTVFIVTNFNQNIGFTPCPQLGECERDSVGEKTSCAIDASF